MTPRRAEILRLVYDLTAERGCPPTVRELCEYVDIRPSAMLRHLRVLRGHGYLQPAPAGGARLLRLRGVRWVPEFEDGEDGRRAREALAGPGDRREGESC